MAPWPARPTCSGAGRESPDRLEDTPMPTMSNRPWTRTIEFHDVESDDQAHAIVRRIGPHVALALTISGNGDIDVAFDLESAKKIAGALVAACEARA